MKPKITITADTITFEIPESEVEVHPYGTSQLVTIDKRIIAVRTKEGKLNLPSYYEHHRSTVEFALDIYDRK